MSPLLHVPTCFKVSSVANVNFKWGHTKIVLKSIFKDLKVKANFQPRLQSQNNAFYKIYQAFKILFGDLNNLFFFNSFEP